MPGIPIHRRCPWRRRVRALLLLAAGLATACATGFSGPETHVLTVTNRLGRTIQEIRAKTCEQLDVESMALPDSKLTPGETRRFDLPEHCLDLVAYDARGRVVGEQREFHMLSAASWVLQR